MGVCLFTNRNHGNGLIFKEIGTKKYQYKKPNDNGIKYYYKDVVQIFSQLIESEIPPRILEPEKRVLKSTVLNNQITFTR